MLFDHTENWKIFQESSGPTLLFLRAGNGSICTMAGTALILGSGAGTKMLTPDTSSALVPLHHAKHSDDPMPGEGAQRTENDTIFLPQKTQ